MDGGERGTVVVLGAVRVAGDELGRGGLNGAREGFDVAALRGTSRQRWDWGMSITATLTPIRESSSE